MTNIDWNNLYKVRIANSIKSMEFHEVVKTLLVMKLLEKHKKERMYIRIYTEFTIKEEKKVDIYYENLKQKAAYAFEIQKNISQNWLGKVKNIFNDWIPFGCNTADMIVIDLNKLPKDLDALSLELDKFII